MQKLDASTLSWWDMTPEIVREKINQRIMSIEAPTPVVATVVDRTIHRDNRATPIRIYKPNTQNNLPVILLIHGGAWVAGNLDTHDNLARYLCSRTLAIVVSVDYLNAPEGKYPFSLEQCYDALTWISENRNEFSSIDSGLAVVGDSAGGNMAAALCLMARDRSGPSINLQVLINPAPDLACNGTIFRKNDSLDNLRWQAFQYLSDPQDANHPYVSPLKAEDLSNLPPALILVAEQDDLRIAGEQYGQRLQAANVPAQIYCQKRINHLAGDGARASSKAEESLNVAVSAIQDAFLPINTQVAEHMSNKNKNIMQAANQYLVVLGKIGDPHNKYDPENISKLCAHNCKKVRNGKTLFEQKAHFADQLKSGKEWLGSWFIHPLETLAIPDSNSAVIRYELTTEKEGQLLVFVILKFDENCQIYEIDEVHNKIDP